MQISRSSFGKIKDGQEITCFHLENSKGAYVNILDYGATIQSIVVPDRTGKLVDVCLGYDSAAAYEDNDGHLGGSIGRYGNRIGKAEFVLNGKTYKLAKNNNQNHLHGGPTGFDRRVWQYEIVADGVVFKRVSPDGEEHYPGTLTVAVKYSFNDDNLLTLDYQADTDQDTVVNLTNHAYFNLNGADSGTMLNQFLQLHSDKITEMDYESIPTGKYLPVENTPFDFRQSKEIGAEIDDDTNEQIRLGRGYDHNFVLAESKELREFSVAYAKESGIQMTAQTTMPGVQLYSGNFLNGMSGKNSMAYQRRSGFCLETQYFPNSLALPQFPSPILKAGQHYHHVTTYGFSIQG